VASRETEKSLLAVKEWFQCLPDGPSYITGESMEAAFALTLCMNRTRDRHPYENFPGVPKYVTMLHRILLLTTNSENDPLYAERETANMIQKIRCRCLFTTVDGHIGTAPAGAQIGKLVFPTHTVELSKADHTPLCVPKGIPYVSSGERMPP
jgi:hypothetical protein